MSQMKKILLVFIIALGFAVQKASAQFETMKDSVVQLYGVVMTADSLEAIPSVSIVVKGQNRGTISNEQGVFSIVVLKGDKIEFTSVGYKPKLVEIPRDIEGNQYSIIQLMVVDTVYLPITWRLRGRIPMKVNVAYSHEHYRRMARKQQVTIYVRTPPNILTRAR